MRKVYHVHLENAKKNKNERADNHPIVTIMFPMTIAQDGQGGMRGVVAQQVTCESGTLTHWNVEKNYIETVCDGPIVIDGLRLEADQGLVLVGNKWVLPT